MARFEAEGPIDIDLAVGVGHIEVVASDRADLVVDVTPTNAARSGDLGLVRDTTVAFEAGRLSVVVPKRLNLFGPTDSVDVRVQAPTGSRLAVASAYGAVRALGRLGDARITAKYGSVAVDAVDALVLDAPYGDSDIDTVGGRLEAAVGHGRLRIGRIGGDARVRASHGTVDLGTTVGPVDVATSGALTIDRALDSVTARGAYGAIRIREVTAGSVRVENGYAEVEVGVPFGVAAWLDAASAHGTVRNELTPDPTAAGGERTVELRLRASFADVVVRRSARTASAAGASA